MITKTEHDKTSACTVGIKTRYGNASACTFGIKINSGKTSACIIGIKTEYVKTSACFGILEIDYGNAKGLYPFSNTQATPTIFAISIPNLLDLRFTAIFWCHQPIDYAGS